MEVAEFVLALAEPQVQERIAHRFQGVHGGAECSCPFREIAAQEAGIADGRLNPGRRLPLSRRFREQRPRLPVLVEGGNRLFLVCKVVAPLAEADDLFMYQIGEFRHGILEAAGP